MWHLKYQNDISINRFPMTPKIYQQAAGKTISIVYAIAPCPLGYLLVATTEKGICSVKLGDEADKLEHILNQEFHQAHIMRDDQTHREWIQAILDLIAGGEAHLDLPLDIRGTAFQKQVWQALQRIPYGETRTYTDIARNIAKPQAVRAVGNACGANPIALIVPCHRVLRSDGSLGGYHWGIERKQKLLIQESTRKGNSKVKASASLNLDPERSRSRSVSQRRVKSQKSNFTRGCAQ